MNDPTDYSEILLDTLISLHTQIEGLAILLMGVILMVTVMGILIVRAIDRQLRWMKHGERDNG